MQKDLSLTFLMSSNHCKVCKDSLYQFLDMLTIFFSITINKHSKSVKFLI